MYPLMYTCEEEASRDFGGFGKEPGDLAKNGDLILKYDNPLEMPTWGHMLLLYV